MSKYNFFISYCRTDGKDIAMQIYKQLTAKGYSVFMDIETINSSSNFFEIITEAIASCDCFVPVITENYLLSSWAKKELETALFTADNRATPVLAVLATDYIDEIPLHYRRHMTFIKFDNENLSSSSANKLVEKIDDFIGFKLKSSLLYEKLAEYKKIGNHNKEATVLCELISLNRRSRTTIPTKTWCKEMITLYEYLSKYTGDYDKKSISTAHKILCEFCSEPKA